MRSIAAQLAALTLLLTAISAPAAEDYQHTLVEDGRTLTGYNPKQRDALIAWIEFIADALRQVYGHWPRQAWRISISPTAAAINDPIPWAQVNRDTVDTLEFFTTPQATTVQLKHEWTGYHELAHLLIPYRGWGDHWFSEGPGAALRQQIVQPTTL